MDTTAWAATESVPSVNEDYQFVPTWEIIKQFERHGWNPSDYRQSGIRKRKWADGYQRHLVMLSKEGLQLDYGISPTIIIVNSHDRSCGLRIAIGLFRLLCSNQLVIGNMAFQFWGRHVGNIRDRVEKTVERVHALSPEIRDNISRMNSTILTDEEKRIFALQAIEVREAKPIGKVTRRYNLQALLEPRRQEDRGNDLWLTFNVIQENFMNGGTYSLNRAGKPVRSSGLRNIRDRLRVNTGLWNLAAGWDSLADSMERAS